MSFGQTLSPRWMHGFQLSMGAYLFPRRYRVLTASAAGARAAGRMATATCWHNALTQVL